MISGGYQGTPVYRDNKRYIRQNHGIGEAYPTSDFRDVEILQDADIFQFDTMSLILFIKLDGRRTRLIYAAPFSS